jgi:hypothetical protein
MKVDDFTADDALDLMARLVAHIIELRKLDRDDARA